MNRYRVALLSLVVAFLAAASTAHATTTVNLGTVTNFTGPGDLDFSGNMTYAIAVGNNQATPFVINGVPFRNDAFVAPIVGYSQNFNQIITGGFGDVPNYGASPNDVALSGIVRPIRWSSDDGGPGARGFNLDVVPGEKYKLQTIIQSNNENRSWDVVVEGALAVDNITSRGLNPPGGGFDPPAYAVNKDTVWTYTFVATDSQVNVRFSKANVAPGVADDIVTDTNPILSAVTLENLRGIPNPVASIGTFSGGDAGEGLDLDGNIIYAVNFGDAAAPPLPVRDATFTNHAATPGLTFHAQNTVNPWGAINFGATTNDDNLERVMNSIRYGGPGDGQVMIDLSGLELGRQYKLQLLFKEECCSNRVADIFVENILVVDEYNFAAAQGGLPATMGSVVTINFEATDPVLNIMIAGLTPGTDTNAIINGLTLELAAIPEPMSATLAIVGFAALTLRRRKLRVA